MKNVFTKANIKYCFNYVGLWVSESSVLPYSYDRYAYITTDGEKVKAHKELLKAIEKKEDDRLVIIDTKTSQLITYTGIVFSALSLFFPVLLDKMSDQSLFIRILFILILIGAFVFYVLTIHNAIRNYNIKKFRYGGSDPNNVIKYQNKTVDQFTTIEIQDLLYSCNQNLKTNNDKANNLIYAYRTFRLANFLTAILGILVCFSLLFAKQKDISVTIKNPIQIRSMDSITSPISKKSKDIGCSNKICTDTISDKDRIKH